MAALRTVRTYVPLRVRRVLRTRRFRRRFAPAALRAGPRLAAGVLGFGIAVLASSVPLPSAGGPLAGPGLGAPLPCAAADKDDKERLRRDLRDDAPAGDWIYDDVEAGFARAAKEKKPVCIVFR